MKHILILIILMIVPGVIMAQHKKNNAQVEKELLEFKVKYLAQEMELKSDQQNKFIEIYTRKMADLRKIYEPAIKMQHHVKHDKNVKPEEYQKATDMMVNAKAQEAQLDKKYDDEFKKFLSAKQLYKMKQGEKEFRAKLQNLRGKKR